MAAPDATPTSLGTDRLTEAAWQAYVVLLRFPITLRLKYQPQLCELRDALASALHVSNEEVQTMAEEWVEIMGGLI